MTDEAIVAPAAPSAAVIDAPAPNTPELGSQTPVAPKAEPKPEAKPEPKAEKPVDKPSKSADEAVRRANEAVKARNEAAEKAKPAAKPEAKVETKAEPQPRADGGKFASKESQGDKPSDGTVQAKTEGDQTSEGRKPHHEAPARFNDRAKSEWATAPDSIKEEVHRALSENEKGIQKYKEPAERYEKIREYDDLARKNGREGVHESLKQVVEIEQAFSRDPIEGLKKITDHFGVNLQAVAAHIMGENPDQRVQQAHTRIQELEAKVQHMELAAKAPDIVREFAEAHDRFDELSEVIAVLLKNGTAKDLEGAYELASVLRPASNAAENSQPLTPANSAPAQTQAPADIPLNPAGLKSVSGAPTGGITPASKRPVPKSNLDALKSAAARVG
jgi:hypothetical protein